MLRSIKNRLKGHSAAPAPAPATPSRPDATRTPKADTHLPRRQRRRSSIIREEKVAALRDLPMLKDTSLSKREILFKQKLALCSVIFNFDNPASNKRGKELKRMTLLEIVDYVNSPGGQKIFTENVMPDVIAMVSTNLFRALPPQTEDYDPEEDEPVLEPSWPHLQVVYEFLLRFVVSGEVKGKIAKRYLTQKFCLKLIDLFDSEDPRERDYLKTILHRVYGKFMSHRSFIRRTISNTFYRFVYETERHNGIGELLEILGSIINGFALPLKQEHVVFLRRALIPLHRPKCMGLYHQQLSYCITQYVEKDPETAVAVCNGIFRYWPWSSTGKQVIMLNEMEEVLELVEAEQIAKVGHLLFSILAKCVCCSHFQVAERALFLWNNEHLINHGCLSRAYNAQILPLIYASLYENSQGHWNMTVEQLAQNVLKHYMESDPATFEQCAAAYEAEQERGGVKVVDVRDRWKVIEETSSGGGAGGAGAGSK